MKKSDGKTSENALFYRFLFSILNLNIVSYETVENVTRRMTYETALERTRNRINKKV
jgi:hypothetical protein